MRLQLGVIRESPAVRALFGPDIEVSHLCDRDVVRVLHVPTRAYVDVSGYALADHPIRDPYAALYVIVRDKLARFRAEPPQLQLKAGE